MALERKVCRRQGKYKNILKKDYNIHSDNVPSKSLMICNAGLVSNFNREDVLNLCQNFGRIESIVMPEGKSYSFISFDEVSNAVKCYEQINGKMTLSCVNGPLYLLFVDQIPKGSTSSNFSELPPGLILVDNFVSENEENVLLDCVKLDISDNLGELKNRLVKHFGYEFLYGSNNIDRDSPLEQKIPVECNIVFDRLKEQNLSDIVPWIPDQLTVNQYKPGQGIPSHIDTHSAFEDPILSLSLGSDVVMDFKQGSKTISVVLPRRSLLIMSEESRYCWSHGICPRKSDVVPHPDSGLTSKKRETRTSFTFRLIRHSPCNCAYKTFCDSQKEQYHISDDIAPSLESTYVHEVYSKISGHFSNTRHKPWPNVLDFVKSFPSSSVMVDVGCGNGKYFGHMNNMVEIGLDQCQNLIEICRERGFEGVVSNCLSLPLISNIADCVICIAVIHHLSTKLRRIQAIREMSRITRTGGKILIYAWSKNQSANDKASSYLKQSRKNRKQENSDSFKERKHNSEQIDPSVNQQLQELQIKGCSGNSEESNLKLPLHENRTAFQHHDLLVPWKLKTEKNATSYPTYHRFYHVFEENELEELCQHVANVKIEKSYYDQGNWCVILNKIS